MTDKVQKIREEVEKLKDELNSLDASSYTEAYIIGATHTINSVLDIIDSLQEEPVSEYLNTESTIESYKQRLISQANGMKNSPLINMCLASYKHGINETLDTLNLSNVQRTVKASQEEPVSIWHDISEDAFMKRATEWLQGFMECSSLFEYQVSEQEQEKVIKEFQNFMKGE